MYSRERQLESLQCAQCDDNQHSIQSEAMLGTNKTSRTIYSRRRVLWNSSGLTPPLSLGVCYERPFTC